jgi:hypothetical protein
MRHRICEAGNTSTTTSAESYFTLAVPNSEWETPVDN